MLNFLRRIFRALYLKRLIRRGLILGRNFQFEKGSNIDANFPWLIEIGDDVTFASEVFVIAHDGASKKHIGYSKVGKVKIENNVFIGAKSSVLPNVTIGSNSIIGANSVVASDIPSNSVAAGIPAKVIMDLDTYIEKQKESMKKTSVYGKEYTIRGG